MGKKKEVNWTKSIDQEAKPREETPADSAGSAVQDSAAVKRQESLQRKDSNTGATAVVAEEATNLTGTAKRKKKKKDEVGWYITIACSHSKLTM